MRNIIKLGIGFIMVAFVCGQCFGGNLLDLKKNKTLVFKGFYIGMPAQELVDNLNKYPDVFSARNITFLEAPEAVKWTSEWLDEKYGKSFIHFSPPSPQPWIQNEAKVTKITAQNIQIGAVEGTLYFVDFDRAFVYNNRVIESGYRADDVTLDDNGRLNYISLGRYEVDRLFNVKDLDWKTFAGKFSESYKIELEPTTVKAMFGDRHFEALQYISPEGYEIVITEHKQITFRAVTTDRDRKFD